MSFIDPHFHTYEQKESLAHALAASVAQALTEQVLEQGSASLAVSGGRTPGLFFAALAAYPLKWSSIVVTLVDERWVPPTSPRSNEALVHRELLIDYAKKALFLPLHASHVATPEEGCATINDLLEKRLPLPFAAVVLGMGEDGHTASFFPGADLSTALDMTTPNYVAPIRAEAAGEPRITLTLPTLLNTRHLFIHFEGEAKKAVYDQAYLEAQEDVSPNLPIAYILQHAPIRPQVFWCF